MCIIIKVHHTIDYTHHSVTTHKSEKHRPTTAWYIIIAYVYRCFIGMLSGGTHLDIGIGAYSFGQNLPYQNVLNGMH